MSFRKGWIPAIVAPVAVIAAAVTVPAIASAASPPPDRSPAQVLALIAGSHGAHYSGTVEQSSDLGLPQLPSTPSTAPSSNGFDAATLIEFATSAHKVRVYVDGESKHRVQLLDTLGERDVIQNGTSVWTYDAKAKTATHLTTSGDTTRATPSPTTPAALADEFIASITPSTTVTVSTGTDLGRGVYRLTLAPKTSATLVDDAVITVDAETGVPLGVKVDARGQSTPALSVAFTSVDFSAPSAGVFAFTPPTGTTVKTVTPPATGPTRDRSDAQKPTVIGSGWSAIVKVSGHAPSPTAGLDAQNMALLNQLTQKVTGGRMLETSLFSVYLGDDGTVLAGAVPTSALLAAAR